jgi:DNA-binding NarL/FixJ family response regulator
VNPPVTKIDRGGILPPMAASSRVLIVEDDALARSTMSAALTACGLVVTGEAPTAAVALRLFTEKGADVALLDLDLGTGPSGLDLASELRKRDPKVGLVILTSFDDPRLLDPSLTEIPAGTIYLRKRQVSSVKDLREAIDLAIRHPGRSADTSAIRTHELTDGNFSLLRDIARGLTNAQLAHSRGISVSAVEKSIRRLAATLGISESTGNQRALLIQSYNRMSGRDVRS